MKNKLIILLALVLVAPRLIAANEWPQVLPVNGGSVTIYEPQPEKLTGNKLQFRAAISISMGSADPLFGAMWAAATLEVNRDTRQCTLSSIKVTNLRLPDVKDTSKVSRLRALLESGLPRQDLSFSLDRIVASIDELNATSDKLNNTPPRIIYATQPSLLVAVDGEPVVRDDKSLGLPRVVNTPFVVVRQGEKFYLYANEKWFAADSLKGDWQLEKSPSKELQAIGAKLKAADEKAGDNKISSDVTPEIVVSTVPTELIQTNGKAEFKPIQGTNLLYVSNTEDNIFMDITNQQYYVLISGRWYTSKALNGGWAYVEGKSLPADFAKIPEGSPKDVVLASVPGTKAAKEAVADAQMPQTAKVDRKNATTKVTYDGKPEFKPIDGTKLEYAVNTSSTVLKEGKTYYAVDNGVWFTSSSADGPWKVATERPKEVDKIPADNPTYNVKYVYIYDVTPDFVWMGYTPGYMGCYVYGGAVVYGTGFYYAPWYGTVYYPRPVTWGFSMHYNPWTGWTIGVGVSVGFMHFGFAFHPGPPVYGWWGAPMYHPPFYYPYSHFYGPRPPVVAVHNNIVVNNINVNNAAGRTTNIYSNRPHVNAHNQNISGATRSQNLSGATRATAGAEAKRAPARASNNLSVDRNGDVYRHDEKGQVQRRSNNGWQNTRPTDETRSVANDRSRGDTREANFEHSRGAGYGGFGAGRGGGGGRRR